MLKCTSVILIPYQVAGGVCCMYSVVEDIIDVVPRRGRYDCELRLMMMNAPRRSSNQKRIVHRGSPSSDRQSLPLFVSRSVPTVDDPTTSSAINLTLIVSTTRLAILDPLRPHSFSSPSVSSTGQ